MLNWCKGPPPQRRTANGLDGQPKPQAKAAEARGLNCQGQVACGQCSATLPLCAQLRHANSAQISEEATMSKNAETMREEGYLQFLFSKRKAARRSPPSSLLNGTHASCTPISVNAQ